MKKHHRILSAGLAAILFSMAAGWVFAEVSVQLDGKGKYRHVLILQGSRGGKPIIWQQVRPGVEPNLLLNPRGDDVGDLPPDVREHPARGLPWAVWSLSDGTDYEIAFSLFNGRQWVVPRLLETKDNPYHDLDPVLRFASDGTPVVVWWRASPVPQVYLSLYRRGTWSTPLRLSDPDVDSRHPKLQIDQGEILVKFKTKSGAGKYSSALPSLGGLPPLTGCSSGPVNCDISDGPDVDGETGDPDDPDAEGRRAS